jgi:energy-coupling factor transporter ATP-binding protein EcfA2
MMNTPEIRVRNIGPVVDFEYQLPDYGIHVIKGPQGSGKSTITRVADVVVNSQKSDLSRRDGTSRGEAYVAGAKFVVMSNTREEGEPLVDGLDVSIAELHSPKYDTPAVRDKHRIRILNRLAGVKADAALFRALLPDWFDSIVPEDSLRTDDIVEMAARVKRAIESEAQRVEKRQETSMANARAQAAVADGVDVSVECDEQVLQNSLAAALEGHARLRSEHDAMVQRANDAATAVHRAQDARERLAKIGQGITPAEAQAKRDAAKLTLVDAQHALAFSDQKRKLMAHNQNHTSILADESLSALARETAKRFDVELIVRDLEEKLREARESLAITNAKEESLRDAANDAAKRKEHDDAELAEANKEFDSAVRRFDEATLLATRANQTLEAATRESELYSELMATIDAATTAEAPTTEEIYAAANRLTEAKERVEERKRAITLGASARAAKQALSLSQQHMDKAKRLQDEADQLRAAAKDTSTVLSNAIATIPNCPLRVVFNGEHPRLVTKTDRSDEELIEDLSDGERWMLVVQIAAAHNRLLILRQSAWGELSPSSRIYLDRLAKENHCWILTAEAADCELHGEPYQP